MIIIITAFKISGSLYKCTPQNKLSLDISSCDDDRFVQGHLTVVWVCNHSVALHQRHFPFRIQPQTLELNLELQSFVKSCTRIWWLNRIKGLGGFFLLILSWNRPEGPYWSRTSYGTSLDRFLPFFFLPSPSSQSKMTHRDLFSAQEKGTDLEVVQIIFTPILLDRTESHDHS